MLEGNTVRRWAFLLLILSAALVGVGCTTAGQPTEAPPNPVELVTGAAANVRNTSSFRMEVTQVGGDYLVYTEYGTVIFRRTLAQYVAPGLLQADVRVLAAGIPIDIVLFSNGQDQWYRAVWTGNQWLNAPWAEGFNPAQLISEESGFEAALSTMIDLDYIGMEDLEDGTPTYHLAGPANGPDVSALTLEMITARGTVDVDVYIHRELNLPVRFIITEPAGTQDIPDPITWTIDMYDYNAEPTIDIPAAAAESTSEAPEAAEGTATDITAAIDADATATAVAEAAPETAS